MNLRRGNKHIEFTIIHSGDSMRDQNGVSVICYRAFYTAEDGQQHGGQLRQFHLPEKDRNLQSTAEKYISSYKSLQNMALENRHNTFVPDFEIYYDDDDCPYIWIEDAPLLTFGEICERLMQSRENTESILLEIVTILKSLTERIEVLHDHNLIHGDIEPSGFGLYVRDDKVLTNDVSFLNLDKLSFVWNYPKDQAYRTDIKAIGTVLCRALGLTDRQIGSLNQENARKIIFSAALFEQKGIPKDEQLRRQLTGLILGTVTDSTSVQISSCAELLHSLQILETYLLPYRTEEGLQRGSRIEIVNRELRRRDKVFQVFQYLLYSRPLYQWQGEGADTYRIQLFGFGLDSQSFLDICLQAVQSLSVKAQVDVWDTAVLPDERDYYLKERPALCQFFSVNGKEEELTGDPYGEIHFHTEPDEILKDHIEKIVANSNPNYIYVALGNDRENAETAKNIVEAVKDRHVSVNAQCENAVNDENGIHYVCVNEDVTQAAEYKDIERMSFNTHLVWSGSLNADLARKRSEYNGDYYHASSFSLVLSIKYKMHDLGIEISNGDYYRAAAQFRENSTSELKQRLAASEHRRWVAEKICSGWTKLETEESLQFNGTKDAQGKRHICIVRSGESIGLSGAWADHSRWDDTAKALDNLDELDRMSVELHRAYRNYVQNTGIDLSFADRTKRSFLEETEGLDSVQNLFMEWYNALWELYNAFVIGEFRSHDQDRSLTEYERLYHQLLEVTEQTEGIETLRKQSIRNKISAVHAVFTPVMRCLRYHDYKKNDLDIIDHIPFILTYTDNIGMVVPVEFSVLSRKWENTKPSKLFSYVAAATVVNPRRLYLPYISSGHLNEETSAHIAQKEEAIRRYSKRKGLQTEIRFVPLAQKTDLKDILDTEEDVPFSVVLFEDNNITTVIGNKGSAIRCRFDRKQIRFTSGGNHADVQWLNDIDRKVGLTVLDVTDFLGRKTDVEAQPFFRQVDMEKLFEIYSSDRGAWKNLCGVLGTGENKNQEITTFTNPSYVRTQNLKHCFYILPYSCFKAVKSILQQLKERDIVDGESVVTRYSADACALSISTRPEYRDTLNELFRRQHLLASDYEYSVDSGDDKFVLRRDGLEMESIQFQGDFTGELRILRKLQLYGFIRIKEHQKSFDITYGSRQIKDLFMEEGRFLEVYTYYKCRQAGIFDGVVTGIKLSQQENPGIIENEIDCFVTKGFQTVIVECKARATSTPVLNGIQKRLREKIDKFGINGSGILIVDSERDVPEGSIFEGIRVCRKTEELERIGEIVGEIMG